MRKLLIRRYLAVIAAIAVIAVSTALFGVTPARAGGCGPSNPNCIVPTAPPGTSNNQAASTAFVQTAAGAAITALTGDGTAAGPGSAVFTLATVNSNVGSFGDATHCVAFTTNGKGLITAASSVVCTPAFASLTGRGTLAQLPQGIANSIFINPTGSTANMQNVAVPACANDGAHALVYVNGTGLACAAITAAGGTVTTAGTGLSLSGGGTTLNLALTNAVLQANPTPPGGTGSTTGVMEGLGSTCHLTPVYSGRIKVEFIGVYGNNTIGNASTVKVFFGTGTAPASGAAPTGTQVGNSVVYGNGSSTSNVPFVNGGIITGLTPGTAYWFDLSLAASANTSTIQPGLSCNAVEF